jgi:hypothetical protein
MASIVDSNAIATAMSFQTTQAQLAQIGTIATGTMMLKLLREPLSLDSVRSIMELMAAGSVAPPAPAPPPAAPAPAATTPAAPAAGADPLGTGIGLEV